MGIKKVHLIGLRPMDPWSILMGKNIMNYGYNAPRPVLFINKMLKFGQEAANGACGLSDDAPATKSTGWRLV